MPNISILFEDENLLAIDKPAGLLVHDGESGKEKTVASWFLLAYPEAKGVGDAEDSARSGVVHRLDKDTSGVMLLAKNQETFLYLKRLFQDRKIKKEYRAFVYGKLKQDFGTIDRAIGRSPRDFRRWLAHPRARGKKRDAITEYEVLKRGGDFSYLRVLPQTGRTHQIRVHFKAINHPIVCDSLYAENMPPALGFARLALHSHKVSFSLPREGGAIIIEAPLPADFKVAEEAIAKL